MHIDKHKDLCTVLSVKKWNCIMHAAWQPVILTMLSILLIVNKYTFTSLVLRTAARELTIFIEFSLNVKHAESHCMHIP